MASRVGRVEQRPALRAALVVHAAACYSLGAATLRSKAFGLIWDGIDGSLASRATSDPRGVGSGGRWDRTVRWIRATLSGGKRDDFEEGLLGALDMLVAWAVLRRFTRTSLLFYPLMTLPLPLALPHLVAASSTAALAQPPLSGIVALVQSLPTATLHELSHLLALVLFSYRRRFMRRHGSQRTLTASVVPRGRAVAPRTDDDEGCCICFSHEGDDPLEAFCVSTSPPFARHLAHRTCLLTWYYTSRRRSLPAPTPSLLVRRQALVSTWTDALLPSASRSLGVTYWRASMAEAAQGPQGWSDDGGADDASSDDDEEPSSTSSSPNAIGGPWNLGRLSSVTVADAPTRPSPAMPGVHLRVDPAFVRARNDRGRPFWWAIDASELDDVLDTRDGSKPARVVGEVTSAGQDAPSCPVCRSPLSILMELRIPGPTPPSPRRTSSGFLARVVKLWRRRLGPSSFLNKLLLHMFMRVLLSAAVRGWTPPPRPLR